MWITPLFYHKHGTKGSHSAFHLNLWSCERHMSASKQPCNCISYAMHIHVRTEALELVTRARSQFLLALDVDVVRSRCLGRRGRKWGYAVGLGEGDIFDKGLLFITLVEGRGARGDGWCHWVWGFLGHSSQHTTLCYISNVAKAVKSIVILSEHFGTSATTPPVKLVKFFCKYAHFTR